jgi:hypothetical protein
MTAILAAVATSGALAAKGGGKGGGGGGGKPGRTTGGGTISLVLLNDANGDGLPTYGDAVTFNASTTATTEPHVRLQCFQSGTLVYQAEAGMYASYPWPWEQTMTLSSSWWPSGAADCTGQIFYFSGGNTAWGASTNFHVDG